jgi:acetylglutamate kinase
MVKEKYMEKANVLIEALPYIQRFNRKIIVIKYGGSAMIDDELKKHVIEDAVLLKLVGFKPVIVHGGGNEISSWMRKTGIEPQFINGLRVTDADTLEIAEMVLGKVNSDLVTMAQQLGVRACGISGKDGRLLTVKRAKPGMKDIGFVGEVTEVDTKIINDLLNDDFLPIIYPIGMDKHGQSYNINGDHAAAEIAKGDAKSAEKTLDLAISANPGSYYAYYNMARLMVRAKGNKEAAKRYYETGRRYGGPKDAALEGILK